MFTKLRYNSVTKFFKFVTSPFSYRSSTSTNPKLQKLKSYNFCIRKLYHKNNIDYQLVTEPCLYDTKIQTFRTKLYHTNFTNKS